MNRNVSVIRDHDGNHIVVIHDIIFKNKRNIEWNNVENYLKQYIGEVYSVVMTDEYVHIGQDLPDEYAHSNYTKILKGANAKAKANAVQGLPEIIHIAYGRQHEDNHKEKHMVGAKYGWNRYESRFALPVYDDKGKLERYNVFHAVLLMRLDKDGKEYLYDIMNIKKETSMLFQSEDFTQ